MYVLYMNPKKERKKQEFKKIQYIHSIKTTYQKKPAMSRNSRNTAGMELYALLMPQMKFDFHVLIFNDQPST
jgi:hypothetical protein